MIKRFILLITLALLTLTAHGVTEYDLNLEALYLEIDQAIDSSEFFLLRKTALIETLKNELRRTDNDAQRFEASKRLYQEYVPFENDSALAYQYKCLDLAERLGRDDLYAETLIALADQLTESGFYHEACSHFDRVSVMDAGLPALPDSLLTAFLLGLNHLYGEMGYYSHDSRLKDTYLECYGQLLDSLLLRLDTTSVAGLQLRTMTLANQDSLCEAMHFCELWQQLCEPESRAWATMAYYRAVIYGQQGDVNSQRYWLARSALVDIRHAIMDQGALWSLAESFVNEQVEIDRANRYMEFSWQCLSRFTTHMRSWLVAPVLTRINGDYKLQLQRANSRLRYTNVVISLLAIGLLGLIFYLQKKRRQLANVRNELSVLNPH